MTSNTGGFASVGLRALQIRTSLFPHRYPGSCCMEGEEGGGFTEVHQKSVFDEVGSSAQEGLPKESFVGRSERRSG